MNKLHLVLALAGGLLSIGCNSNTSISTDPSAEKFVHNSYGNPYLPLWEHLPDGEPRVFEDPDKPGSYRAYIIGSHDVRFDSYCGADIRMWSAPVEDLSKWRDEGAIFTYNIENQWDVMYAPDLVEVNHPDGKREYYLYPHSRGRAREAMVCKGDRPDGPFTPINLNAEGTAVVEGSILGFDPSIFVEPVTAENDSDATIGFRAYGYWGFQHSSAAQLDPKTMYSARPGTDIKWTMLPAIFRHGRNQEKQEEYPCLFEGEDPHSFNFFEASSIRQVGNKYVVIYSGFSGKEYGLGMSNSTLRYAYGDTPLGPWKNGGVLVDSRAPVTGKDGKIIETNAAHNTHGSIQQINGQWYVFYHRPPRGFGYARQAMVAPIKIEYDEKSVAEGGKVVITGYDPYTEDNVWTAKSVDGNDYTGAEVTSEGFAIFGLPPYQYYSAGYACFFSDNSLLQDSWDIWDNHADVAGVKNNDIVGFKYFGFGGVDKDTLGVTAFEGTKEGNNTHIHIFLTSRTDSEFKINIMLDSPWEDKGGKLLSSQIVTEKSGEYLQIVNGCEGIFDTLDKKHAIYVVAEGAEGEKLFDLHGIAFSKNDLLEGDFRPKEAFVNINDRKYNMPAFPIRSTNENGILGYDHYELSVPEEFEGANYDFKSLDSEITVTSETDVENKTINITYTYKGVNKYLKVSFEN
ncbi:MAG: hypothetical protein Q4C30_06720 [Bacteroidia bacterium]|nr:hypothetical protein [Bacteroidia bacterium]